MSDLLHDHSSGNSPDAEKVRLRAAIASMLDPYVILEAVRAADGSIVDFVYTEANDAACAFNLKAYDELVGLHLLALHPAAATTGLLDAYRAIVETGEALVLDDWLYPQDILGGEERRYDVRAVKVGDGLGQTWRDVTDRYLSNQLMARREQDFRLLAENASDVVIRTAGGIASWVSPSVTEVLGWDPSDLVGTDLTLLVHPDDRAPIEAARDGLSTGTASRLRYRVRSASGTWRWMEASTRLWVGSDGQPSGTVGSLRDIDDQVAATTALAASEDRLRGTIDSMLDAWVILEAVRDGDGRIVDFVYAEANEAACRSNGIPRDRLVGSRLSQTLPVLAANGAIEIYAAVVDTGQPFIQDEYPFVDARTGSSGYFDNRGVRVGDGLSLTWRDVTERHKVAEALAESEDRFRLAMTNSAVGMCLVGPDGHFENVNPALCAMLGRDEQSLTRSTWQELTYAADLDADLDLVADVLAGRRDSYRLLKRYRRPDDSLVWGDLSVSCVRHPDGSVKNFISQIADVTETVAARAALAESESHYRLLAENSSDIVFRSSVDAHFEWVSEAVTHVLGWRVDDLVGRSIASLLHPDDVAGLHASIDVVRSGRPGGYEARWRMVDGTYRWMSVRVRPVHDPNGTVVGRVGGARDIDAEYRARLALESSERRFRTAMESAPAGMAVVSLERRFVEVNPAIQRLTGRSEDWLLGHGVIDLLDDVGDEVDLRMRAELTSGSTPSVTAEHQLVRSDGTVIWVEHSIGLLRDHAGRPQAFVSQFVDVGDRRRARESLTYQATHDPLTELVNRRELRTRIEGLLSRSPRTGTRVAVLFIDLDGLKLINDAYGHAVGDLVIQEVARRIKANVRADDVVARYGGDEYVVVMPAVHVIGDAERVAVDLQASTVAPFLAAGVEIPLSFSIGVAVSEKGDDPDSALGRADAALYRAKRDGRARTVLFDEVLDTPLEPRYPDAG